MSEWEIKSLEDISVSIDYGLTASAEKTATDCKFLRITDIVSGGPNWNEVPFVTVPKTQVEKYKLHGGDIVIARTGATTGSSCYISSPPDAVFASYLVRYKIKPEYNSRYISYYLKSSEWWSFIGGILGDKSAQPNASASTMAKFNLRLPAIDRQTKIAKILSDLDDKIENSRRMNETLEAMAQAIFKSWFVDFDPVRAKVEVLESGGSADEARLAAMQAISGQSPEGLAHLKTENPERYAELAATADAFPSAFTTSPLGEIPEGWEASEIGNEVDVVGGGTPSTKNLEFWEDGTIHWTTPKDMSNLSDKILVDTERKITEAGLKKISSGLLPIDTVLMSSRAPVGYLAIAKVPVAINQGYIAMKCNHSLSPEYVIQWCSHNMDEIKQRASGTTFAEISKKSFNPIPVIVPSLKALKAYTQNIRSIYSKIEALIHENRSLIETRDSLLPKLLSGELSVEGLSEYEE